MTTEETLVLIKPDGVARGLTGAILARIEAKGYALVDIRLVEPDRGRLERDRLVVCGRLLGRLWFVDRLRFGRRGRLERNRLVVFGGLLDRLWFVDRRRFARRRRFFGRFDGMIAAKDPSVPVRFKLEYIRGMSRTLMLGGLRSEDPDLAELFRRNDIALYENRSRYSPSAPNSRTPRTSEEYSSPVNKL